MARVSFITGSEDDKQELYAKGYVLHAIHNSLQLMDTHKG